MFPQRLRQATEDFFRATGFVLDSVPYRQGEAVLQALPLLQELALAPRSFYDKWLDTFPFSFEQTSSVYGEDSTHVTLTAYGVTLTATGSYTVSWV